MRALLEWLLRCWSVVLVVSAGLWVLPTGGSWWLPDAVREFVVFGLGPTDGLYTGVRMGASFTDGTLARVEEAMPDDVGLMAHEANGLGVQNQGDVVLGWSLQFFPSGAQAAAHVVLHVVPLLTMALLWWWLAGAVAQSRREEVFTLPNARRLTVAGAVVALGGPLLALGTWLLERWVLSTSQFADRAHVPAFGPGHVPWGAVTAGLALVVLGVIWRRGAATERELEGLV